MLAFLAPAEIVEGGIEVVLVEGGEAEGIGDLFEDEQEAEDEAEGGVRGGEVIEVATEGALEGLDAGGVPMGEIGEGAGIDLAVLAEGLAEEDGGPGGAVGDGGDVDVYRLSHSVNKRNTYDTIYMPT